jgi:23S rRNA (cytosine1962-C5)-methyltransferase
VHLGATVSQRLERVWSSEYVLARDARLCVVDKPAGVSCAAAGATALVPLPARLAASGLGAVTCLLETPERASGATLLAFAETVGPAPLPPEAVASLTCVAAVEGWSGPRRAPLHAVDPAKPELEVRVIRQNGARSLLEIEGRAAPAAVVAALRRQGCPVVGDDVETAVPATRLMLHVSELRGHVSGRAPLPPEFGSWLSGAAEPSPEDFPQALERALVARHGLLGESEALRLIGEEEGEIAGVSVERYADFAVLYVSSEAAMRHEGAMADCLMDHGALGVYVKRRVRADLRGVDAASLAPRTPLRGCAAPDALAVRIGSVRCSVSLDDGLATGLFLDQRANWQRMARLANHRALLNLFCYTGAFTLAAAAGKASSTVSVDLAGRALSRLSQNLESNGLSGPEHRLLKADVPAWLARALRGGRRFDCVVLDPPSFGTRARGVLSTRRDQPELLDAAVGLLAPGGALLVVSHHRKISSHELCEQVRATCARAGRQVSLEPLVGAWDCPTLPGVSHTKSVLAQLV